MKKYLFIFLFGFLCFLPRAHASIAFVQSTSTTSSSATSTSAHFTSSVTSGDFIIIMEGNQYSSERTLQNCTDTLGNAFVTSSIDLDPIISTVSACYASNVTGGADTTTVTLSGVPTATGMMSAEFSGVATTSPLDVFSGNNSTVANTPTQTATTTLPDLVIGQVLGSTSTPSSSWNSLGTIIPTGVVRQSFEYLIQSSAGAVSAPYNTSGTATTFYLQTAFSAPVSTSSYSKIKLDNTGSMIFSGQSTGTFNYTVNQNYDGLLACWTTLGITAGTVYASAETFNGVAMTPLYIVTSTVGSAHASISLYYMLAPPVGTYAVSTTVTTASSPPVQCANWTGVNQQKPWDNASYDLMTFSAGTGGLNDYPQYPFYLATSTMTSGEIYTQAYTAGGTTGIIHITPYSASTIATYDSSTASRGVNFTPIKTASANNFAVNFSYPASGTFAGIGINPAYGFDTMGLGAE